MSPAAAPDPASQLGGMNASQPEELGLRVVALSISEVYLNWAADGSRVGSYRIYRDAGRQWRGWMRTH